LGEADERAYELNRRAVALLDPEIEVSNWRREVT
jgi:hypothetical protein